MRYWKLSNHVWPRAGLFLIVLSAAAGGGVSTGALAQTLTTLHSFSNSSQSTANPGGDGVYPGYAGLISDASGALYGTTQIGGDYGQGAVFKLIPPSASRGQWTETILYSVSGNDGANPAAGLISDGSGALYGTTSGVVLMSVLGPCLS